MWLSDGSSSSTTSRLGYPKISSSMPTPGVEFGDRAYFSGDRAYQVNPGRESAAMTFGSSPGPYTVVLCDGRDETSATCWP